MEILHSISHTIIPTKQNLLCLQGLGRFFCQRDYGPLPHQGAILENNVPFQICNGPFQISNGPQLWLVKLRASLCIDKYHFLDLYGLCNMKKQIVKPRHPN